MSPQTDSAAKFGDVDFVIALLLAPLILLTCSFALELFLGIRPLAPFEQAPSNKPKTVVIVPAHDEEAILADRLVALREAASGLARILVVADNCSDSTAEIARSLGADVIERNDPSLDPFPIQTCWPDDGGPFITLPMCITKHPVTGKPLNFESGLPPDMLALARVLSD